MRRAPPADQSGGAVRGGRGERRGRAGVRRENGRRAPPVRAAHGGGFRGARRRAPGRGRHCAGGAGVERSRPGEGRVDARGAEEVHRRAGGGRRRLEIRRRGARGSARRLGQLQRLVHERDRARGLAALAPRAWSRVPVVEARRRARVLRPRVVPAGEHRGVRRVALGDAPRRPGGERRRRALRRRGGHRFEPGGVRTSGRPRERHLLAEVRGDRGGCPGDLRALRERDLRDRSRGGATFGKGGVPRRPRRRRRRRGDAGRGRRRRGSPAQRPGRADARGADGFRRPVGRGSER